MKKFFFNFIRTQAIVQYNNKFYTNNLRGCFCIKKKKKEIMRMALDGTCWKTELSK